MAQFTKHPTPRTTLTEANRFHRMVRREVPFPDQHFRLIDDMASHIRFSNACTRYPANLKAAVFGCMVERKNPEID